MFSNLVSRSSSWSLTKLLKWDTYRTKRHCFIVHCLHEAKQWRGLTSCATAPSVFSTSYLHIIFFELLYVDTPVLVSMSWVGQYNAHGDTGVYKELNSAQNQSSSSRSSSNHHQVIIARVYSDARSLNCMLRRVAALPYCHHITYYVMSCWLVVLMIDGSSHVTGLRNTQADDIEACANINVHRWSNPAAM